MIKIDKPKTALLIIDVVNGCCHEKSEDKASGITFTKIRQMVPKLKKFITAYRRDINDQVIFVKLTPWTSEHLPENIKRLYQDPAVNYYGNGGFEEEFFSVRPGDKDLVITKNTYDGFSNVALNKYLK